MKKTNNKTVTVPTRKHNTLTLRREVILKLTSHQLANVAGGGPVSWDLATCSSSGGTGASH